MRSRPITLGTLIEVGPNSQVRLRAAQAVGELTPDAEPAVPALIESLKDEDLEVRYAAAAVLGLIGRKAASAVPALLLALTDEHPQVRESASKALGRIGKAAVSGLITALKDPDMGVRAEAAKLLKKIDPDAARRAGLP
jgi:HEAT repeat protein